MCRCISKHTDRYYVLGGDYMTIMTDNGRILIDELTDLLEYVSKKNLSVVLP